MRLLGGVADDVLHLLDEHGEHAAQRLGIGVVDGQLLLERLADPAQHGLRHITAIGEDDALAMQHPAQIHELGGEHRRLLGVWDETQHREVVAADLLTLVGGERLTEGLFLIGHGRSQISSSSSSWKRRLPKERPRGPPI